MLRSYHSLGCLQAIYHSSEDLKNSFLPDIVRERIKLN